MHYHFAVQGVAQLLFDRRRAEPQNLAFVEWLAWLDVRLVEAHERLFRSGPDSAEYLSVFAIDFLIDLHIREGFLREALAVSERFAHFRKRVDELAKLRARVALLGAEHG